MPSLCRRTAGTLPVLLLCLTASGCSPELSRRFVELPSRPEARTLVVGRSYRNGVALTLATVHDLGGVEPAVFTHSWDPVEAEVLSAYLYRASVAELGLVVGGLDPPPPGREADGRTLRTADWALELILEEEGGASEWGPATLGLLGRYRFFVPPFQCPEGQHDGGDRTCLPVGRCAPGFRDGGGGVCVPPGSCAATYYLGRDGACAPACPTGYYVSQTGLCCPDASQSGACYEACTVGQQRSPSLEQGCVPETWCCDGASCRAPPC